MVLHEPKQKKNKAPCSRCSLPALTAATNQNNIVIDICFSTFACHWLERWPLFCSLCCPLGVCDWGDWGDALQALHALTGPWALKMALYLSSERQIGAPHCMGSTWYAIWAAPIYRFREGEHDVMMIKMKSISQIQKNC